MKHPISVSIKPAAAQLLQVSMRIIPFDRSYDRSEHLATEERLATAYRIPQIRLSSLTPLGFAFKMGGRTASRVFPEQFPVCEPVPKVKDLLAATSPAIEEPTMDGRSCALAIACSGDPEVSDQLFRHSCIMQLA